MFRSKKVRGAVSVFLVIILVPCMVISSIFVDLGRAYMSKSLSQSSADLALNTLMSNYDGDLSDWYGMVASCQNIEEFYTISAEFFLRTISSQGISDDEIYLLSDYYANATGDDTIYDLLQAECISGTEGMVSAVEGTDLTHATMLKDQVVEFMKYRAPIEMTIGIIERLKNSNSKDVQDADANKELTDAKKEHYNAESELLAAAYNTYLELNDYKDYVNSINLSPEMLKSKVAEFATYKGAYEKITSYYVSNLRNTEGLGIFARPLIKLDPANPAKPENIASSVEKDENGKKIYSIDNDTINELLDELDQAIKNFESAKESVITSTKELMEKSPLKDSTTHPIQWWVEMEKVFPLEEIFNAASKLETAYTNASYIYYCEYEDGSWQERYGTLIDEAEDIADNYLSASASDKSDEYINVVSSLEKISNDHFKEIIADNLFVTVNGKDRSIPDALSYMSGELSDLSRKLEMCGYYLGVIINGNEDNTEVEEVYRVKSLDDLVELAKNYDTTLENWDTTANETYSEDGEYTEMAEDDQKEIDLIEQDFTVDEGSVKALKSRLEGIQTLLNSVSDGISKMKFGNPCVMSISNMEQFKSATEGTIFVSDKKLSEQEINSYASSSFSTLYTPSEAFRLENADDQSCEPRLQPDPAADEYDTPEFYTYLWEKFKGAVNSQVRDNQEDQESGKDEGEQAGENAKNKERYNGKGSDITESFGSASEFSAVDGALSTVSDLIDSLINLDITDIRDDLYVTAYIMEMFSYATYEEEGIYSLLSDEDQKKLKLPSSGYRPTEYDDYIGDEKTEKTWLSTRYEDSYNKSLTNKMINATNNHAYCAEVEYILYGGREGKGNAENVKSVYNNIYAIRYALNTVSGFANFYNGNNMTAGAIETVANAVWITTSCIIPKPVTKIVLILILTAFETSKDLDRLQAGFPVELYKSSDEDWWFALSSDSNMPNVENIGGILKIIKTLGSKENPDKGIFYSDYLTLFVYLGLHGKDAENMYKRMADVIDANVGKVTGNSGYTLKNARVYFSLEATIRVKPLTTPAYQTHAKAHSMATTPAPTASGKNQAMPINEKQMSMFSLLTHYNKENAALYKAQKANRKAATSQPANPVPPTTVQSNEGFAIPGQELSLVNSSPIQPTVASAFNTSKSPEKSSAYVQNVYQQPKISVASQATDTNEHNHMGKAKNFGETTVLGAGSMGETTVLSGAMATKEPPHLIRAKNGEKIIVNKPVFRIGKEKSYVDYFIGDNAAISRSHANIIAHDNCYCVIDTNSTNHTYVNDKMIRSNIETPIEHGSKIKLADELFEFYLY